MPPPERPAPRVTVLAGGFGAARLLGGLVRVCEPRAVTAVVNCGDDFVLHGLYISPDLDTITYCLAGRLNAETGWGLKDDSWRALEMLQHLGGQSWFGLGDGDLGTHLYRTQRLSEGAPLSVVTAELASRWGVEVRLLPVTDDRLRTRLVIDDGDRSGTEIGFQEYFVRLHHAVAVRSVRFAGATGARPAPGVLDAIADAAALIIAPSNPIVSIGPVLALEQVRRAVAQRRAATVAISPIVAGAALRGPAGRLMSELGHESSVVGVARLYAPLAGTLVIDEADASLAPAVESEGMRCIVAPSIMHTPADAAALAHTALSAVDRPAVPSR
ncbi:MAG: 2-phospho-L-lactate transferase [Acidimicrobiia bacterium]|nr:2-phospho-L-lactate transferase [Acidimicrobiia bacterium]MYC45293.1 2-phospho-L-lactate transferase [Acidimicrobiia bacterium]